ncbi:MAG: TetR/AcrR family transcriptional regulator [Planctomycetota bacterium]
MSEPFDRKIGCVAMAETASHSKQKPAAEDAQSPPKVDRRTAKSQSTRLRILESAMTLFLGQGFGQTSLEAVAANAGTTKPTVYSHFQSKQGLFDAVLEHYGQHRIKGMGEILQPTENPKSDLIQFGDFFLAQVLSPESQRWDRLAANESMTHPEVGQSFFNAGPRRVLKLITNYLKHQKKAGRLQISHPARAAEQFIGMLLCLDLLRAQIGEGVPSEAQRKRRSREAVDVFLAAYES